MKNIRANVIQSKMEWGSKSRVLFEEKGKEKNYKFICKKARKDLYFECKEREWAKRKKKI